MNEPGTGEWGLPCRSLTPREFEAIRRLAYEHFGLDLRSGKEQLVAARLGKKIREAHFRSFEEYYRYVREDATGEALVGMIDALTTNHTAFFREAAHFEFLRLTVLPALAGRERFRIWSAACATGEEPYTIAICVLDELGPAAAGRVQILATDISTRALHAARTGIYAAERCETIPPATARKHLLRGGGRYRVKPALSAMLEFHRINLMEPFQHLGLFPAIFCRNVMIYFDRPTREGLVRRLARCLEPGGWLLVGHAESLTGIDHGLEYVRPAVYRQPCSLPEQPGGRRRG